MTNATKSPDLTLVGSLLVVQYNEMVATATDIGLTTFKEVNRFTDSKTGLARTEKLHAAIVAQVEALRIAEQEAAELEAKTGREANHETPAPAEETTSEDAPVQEETQDEEATERLPDETEEAHMARKAAKKSAPKKKGAKKGTPVAKKKSTDGTTIRELTEEYNAIVAKMTIKQKEAAPYAKHHTSMFESKDKAKVQLDKLKKAIAKA